MRRPRVLGKYRLIRRLGTGGFAEVYEARDTIEGVRVALKVPHPEFSSKHALDDFRREIRIAASLDHPNILPVKNADLVQGRLVVAFPLGQETLADRLHRRMGVETALAYGEQMLDALAHAHHRRVIHCDVKPENLILFPDGWLRLGDFGIARIALRTLAASGSGTVGYVAPEQAMGKPSFRSDVFSAGLILYRMLAGKLPEWPFREPLPGSARLRSKVPPSFRAFLQRALRVDHRQRYKDAATMLNAFQRLLPDVERYRAAQRRRRR
ncbi:MAG: serine/threonine-protein kinase [Planctomycetota bacterium]|jgi:serine/threonine-protein kinase